LKKRSTILPTTWFNNSELLDPTDFASSDLPRLSENQSIYPEYTADKPVNTYPSPHLVHSLTTSIYTHVQIQNMYIYPSFTLLSSSHLYKSQEETEIKSSQNVVSARKLMRRLISTAPYIRTCVRYSITLPMHLEVYSIRYWKTKMKRTELEQNE